MLEEEEKGIKNQKERNKFQSLRKSNLQTEDAKRHYICYKHYEDAVTKRNFEIDMLLVLANYRAIIEVEVKSISDISSIENVLKMGSPTQL